MCNINTCFIFKISSSKEPITSEWPDANSNYGYMWWVNNSEGNRFWKNIYSNVYYAAGFGRNYIIIIPDEKIVVVTRC